MTTLKKQLEIKKLDKCFKCKKRKARVNFSRSIMDFTHGFTTKICRQCYIKELEETNKINNKMIKEQKEDIKNESG